MNTTVILAPLISQQDVLDPSSPKGLRVTQITPDDGEYSNVYPETPIFLEDRTRFLIRGHDGYYLASLPPGPRELVKVIDAAEATKSVVVSPDGKWIYYVEDNSFAGGGSATLWRVNPQTARRDEITRFEGPIARGAPAASRFYALGTVSSDGKRFCTSAFLGDGKTADAPFGLIVVDLQTGKSNLIAQHRDFCNSHVQYCCSTDAKASRDVMVQMNHGSSNDPQGNLTRHLGPPEEGGTGIYVIRDDGSHWRTVPLGRDGRESNIGHQIWRGSGTSIVTITLDNHDATYGWGDDTKQEVVEGHPAEPAPGEEYRGHPTARRNVLSRNFPNPRFCHLHAHPDGQRFVFDTYNLDNHGKQGQQLYFARSTGPEGTLAFTYLLNTGSLLGRTQNTHAHPIITPDGKRILFNCRRSGTTQIYMIEGIEGL